jgi:hypothetical protein
MELCETISIVTNVNPTNMKSDNVPVKSKWYDFKIMF